MPISAIPPDQITPNNTLVTIYEGEDLQTGQPRFALKPESFRAVMEGYACGHCLAVFGGIYAARCPVCNEPTGAVQAIQPWWTDYPDRV